MNNKQIEEIALANGFKLKEQPDGTMALNPYVFEFARALLESTVMPSIQDENGAMEAAWKTLKTELGSSNWTTGESFTYRGFFAWGWESRRQYDAQSTNALKQELSGCAAVNENANKEIDALKTRAAHHRDSHLSALEEIAALNTEVERLRKLYDDAVTEFYPEIEADKEISKLRHEVEHLKKQIEHLLNLDPFTQTRLLPTGDLTPSTAIDAVMKEIE